MEEAALRRKVRLGSGYDIPLNHRKMYPFYAECEELGCRYQCKLGIFLKLCSANIARPVFLDRIACDFPDLPIIGTHTGWPGNRGIGWLRRILRFCSFRYQARWVVA